MGKTRVLSQSLALYASKTGVLAGQGVLLSGTVATQLHRINSFSFEVDIAGARQDIREYGQLARIGTIMNGDLSPTCSFGYLLTDGENEAHLGFEVKNSITGNFVGNVQAISGFLSEDSRYRERNIFAVTVAEGNDAFSAASWTDRTTHDVVGSSGLYNPSINAATAVRADTGQVMLPVPSVGNSPVDVLRDGQVQVDFSASTALGIGGANLATFAPQSVSLKIPLSREPQRKLGNSLPYTRPLTTPIEVTLSVNAILTETVKGETAALLTGCAGQETRDITIKLYDRCDSSILRLGFLLKNAVLDSQNFGTDLDGNETVDLQFSAQLGGATSITNGIFMTGSYLPAAGDTLNPNLISGMVG